jgi:hypothetical protein
MEGGALLSRRRLPSVRVFVRTGARAGPSPPRRAKSLFFCPAAARDAHAPFAQHCSTVPHPRARSTAPGLERHGILQRLKTNFQAST